MVQNAMIIITPENGTEQIWSQLLSLGCEYWIDYAEVMKIIRFVPAIRALVCDCCGGQKNDKNCFSCLWYAWRRD